MSKDSLLSNSSDLTKRTLSLMREKEKLMLFVNLLYRISTVRSLPVLREKFLTTLKEVARLLQATKKRNKRKNRRKLSLKLQPLTKMSSFWMKLTSTLLFSALKIFG